MTDTSSASTWSPSTWGSAPPSWLRSVLLMGVAVPAGLGLFSVRPAPLKLSWRGGASCPAPRPTQTCGSDTEREPPTPPHAVGVPVKETDKRAKRQVVTALLRKVKRLRGSGWVEVLQTLRPGCAPCMGQQDRRGPEEWARGMGRSTSLDTGSRVCADAGMGPQSGRFCTAFTSAPSARTVWLEQVLGHHLAADAR